MSKRTTYLLGILLTIILGTLLYSYLCNSCYCCPEDDANLENTIVSEPEVKEATRNAFAIADANGNFKVKMNDNFNFKTSNFSILEPISANVTDGVMKLKDYLATNPLKTVTITGYYKSDEINNSAFPNLGLARANAVKNYLVSLGIPSKQIDTNGLLNDDIIPDQNETFFGPLRFGVLTQDDSTSNADAELKAICDAVRANPLVLYFNTGQASINLTEEERQKIADISRCVDKLGVKIQVVGHTDNIGNANNNILLGQQRADFAKGYLVRNGILSDDIEASSKGQIEPIADNATEGGKAKNRRTVITIN